MMKTRIDVRAVRVVACLALTYGAGVGGQQVSDSSFVATVGNPAYRTGAGPTVLIDQGHANFHTKDGRYSPFAAVLEADGYVVDVHAGTFTAESLAAADVLVISNALHPSNVENWTVPTLPAFTDAENEAVAEFVAAGGGLFLIADHMPMPGAAAALAARFGIDFTNGYAFELGDDGEPAGGAAVFRRSDGRIGDHPITRGRSESEAIDQVASFTGSAFAATGGATSLIRFAENAIMLLPTTAWEFNDQTASSAIANWSQGVAIEYGEGRVVIFGEAAMFTAQTGGGEPFGMASEVAEDNQQLLLNIIHWLSGAL